VRGHESSREGTAWQGGRKRSLVANCTAFRPLSEDRQSGASVWPYVCWGHLRCVSVHTLYMPADPKALPAGAWLCLGCFLMGLGRGV
jgi:hypothetical protein